MPVLTPTGPVRWVGREDTLQATALLLPAGQEHGGAYSVVVLTCSFDADVAAQGGYLSASIDGADYVLYR